MPKLTRLRLESIRLPIVDVDFIVQVFKDPNTKKSLFGVRRHVVEKGEADPRRGEAEPDRWPHRIGRQGCLPFIAGNGLDD